MSKLSRVTWGHWVGLLCVAALLIYNIGCASHPHIPSSPQSSRHVDEPRDPETLFALGVEYFEGQDGEQDFKKAAHYFHLAAVEGHKYAPDRLEIMEEKGLGVDEDFMNSVTETQFDLGMRAFEGQDFNRAEKYYRLAAIGGHGDAQFNLGVMYFKGQGVPQDVIKALKCFRRAAKQGIADAQYQLAIMYKSGQGVAQNSKKAVKFYRLAADQGIADAQNNLALMYAEGQGVSQDSQLAATYFRLAAEQGQADAQFQLGRYYCLGKGVTKNNINGVMWLSIAAANGASKATEFSDSIKSEMSPSQLQKVQEAASRCIESQYKNCLSMNPSH